MSLNNRSRDGLDISQGFSLIELLVVLAIISILAVASLAAIQGTQSGVQLKGSGDAVIAELNLARQTASTRNLPVDFRIYQVPDSSGTIAHRVIGLVIQASMSGAATDEYVGKPVVLPGDVVVLPDKTYSSLLDTTASTTSAPIAGTESASAPYLVQNKPFVKFTFLPGGSINLDSTVPWCLTLANQHKKAGVNGGPAANYVAIVMDGQSGRASIFQP